MYKIGGLLFCIVTGILVAKFGWTSFLWAPLGFVFGLFSASQIILPILLGVPIATLKVIKKRMRPNVYFALLRTPLIWIAILFSFGWFFPYAATWVYNNIPLNIASNLGLLLIIFSPLSKKIRQDFREAFDKSYEKYYIDHSNYNLGFTNSNNKVQLKQISAVTTVYSNLYIHDFSPSFENLNFEYPDSRFRCIVFCLSTVVKDCEKLINSQESLQKECLHFLSSFTTSKENIKEFFTQSINAHQAEIDGTIYLDEYLKKWETYYDNIRNGKKEKATEILSSMIHSIGSNKQIENLDNEQLNQLCWQIEFSLQNRTMQGSFIDLLAKKN